MANKNRAAARWTPRADEAALIDEWAGYAVTIGRDYYLVGSSEDDVRQEALIGLLIGIRSYSPDRGMSLKGYLALSVRAWLQSRVVLANRVKARALNEAVRSSADEDGEKSSVVEQVVDIHADPLDVIERRANLAALVDASRSLSDKERTCVMGLANGLSYAQISEALGGVTDKAIDNSIQRGRKKLREAA